MKIQVFLITAVCCALLSVSLSSYAQVSFFQPPTYSGDGRIFVADFNRDGEPDLLTSDGTMNLGNGDGTFKIGTPLGQVYVEVMGDFNGDGKSDLLVHEGVGTYFVLLGNGDGTFQSPIGTAITLTEYGPVVADLNGDGRSDVVEVDANSGALYVFISNGGGTFKPGLAYSLAIYQAGGVSIADFNGDGNNDVLVNGYGQEVSFLGNGDGTLQVPQVSMGVPWGGPSVVGDFNGDGKLDLVVGGICLSCTEYSEYLLLGNGDGTFQTPTTAISNGSGSFVAADVNADGKLDLILAVGVSTAGSSSTVAQIYLGNGDGTFSGPRSYISNFPAGYRSGYLAIGDFNSDGKPDVASAGGILLGNGDGSFQANPLTTLPLQPVSAAVGDFERNGKPDVAVVTSSQSGVVTSNLHILQNDGSGALSLLYTYPLSELGFPLVGDLNGDGNLDLVIVGNPTGGYSVFLGNGDGSFQSPALYKNGDFALATLVDVNHDRTLDLAEEAMGGEIGVSLGNGDGTFAGTVEYLTRTSTQALIIGDFNGDGILDIGYPSGMYELDQNYTEIMYGNGDGTFQSAITPADLNNFGALATADFRNLGRADLLGDSSIPEAPNGNQVALNNGGGTFTILPALPYKGFPVADINGDGRVDLFIPPTLQSPQPDCQTAMALGNGDGTFGSLINVPASGCYPFSSSFPIVDMNGDGRPDIVFLRGPGVGVLLNTTQPGFELSATALSSTVSAGNSATSTVNVIRNFGFNQTVTLSCAGLPTGATCGFSPPSLSNSSGSSALTITTASSTGTGTYSVQVQGTAGSVVNSTALSLVISDVPDFSLEPASGSSTSQTIAAGQAASFVLALSPSGSFTGTINLSCAITPTVSPAPTCSVPSSVQLSGSGSQSVNVKVETTTPITTSALPHPDLPSASARLLWTATLLSTALLCSLRRNRISALARATVVIAVVGLTACGGNSGSGSSHTAPGTPAGTYTTTITATSGTLSHSTTLTVIVQ